MRSYIPYIIIIVLLPYNMLAQSSIDTVLLPEIVLEESRLSNHKIGCSINILDQDLIGSTNTQSFSDFLSFNTSYYVKRYGALSTPTFRGTTSSHTLVLWNEVPLNSIANGLADLSVLPIHSFNKTTIVHGGDASVFGSGSIGASIHINSMLNFNNKNEVNVSYESGSFGLQSKSLYFTGSSKNISYSAFIHSLNDKNNFNFINTTVIGFPEQTNSYGEIISNQGQLNLLLRLSKRSNLRFSYWGTNNDREVPQNMTVILSDAKQYDNSDRAFAALIHTINNLKLKIKHSYVKEDFNYTELSKSINSYYIAETNISDLDVNFNNSNNVFNLGGVLTRNTIQNNNYASSKINDQSIALISSFQNNRKKSKINIVLRKEWHSLYDVPLVPTLSYERKINNNIRFRSKYNMSFRAPSFNDRYWISSGSIGNKNLLPEHAWNKEMGIDIIWNNIVVNSTLYSLDIKDMIIWQPNYNNIWQPINAKKVWSRGIENNLSYKINKLNFEAGYIFTKSTNETKSNSFDNSIGKQLLYVPLHKTSFSLIYNIEKIKSNFIFSYVYNDKVLTSYSSLDDKYLDGFFLTNIAFNKELNNIPIYVIFKVNNLMDKSYQTYENYPNPGREYLLAITYKIN